MNLYQLLGVSQDATDTEIRKVYHKLSLKYHPDKTKNKDDHDHFIRIREAYETLSNPDQRRRYDAKLGKPAYTFASTTTTSNPSSTFSSHNAPFYTTSYFSRNGFGSTFSASHPFGSYASGGIYSNYYRRQEPTFQRATEERTRNEERIRRKMEEERRADAARRRAREQEMNRRARQYQQFHGQPFGYTNGNGYGDSEDSEDSANSDGGIHDQDDDDEEEENSSDQSGGAADAFSEYWKHHGSNSSDPIVVESEEGSSNASHSQQSSPAAQPVEEDEEDEDEDEEEKEVVVDFDDNGANSHHDDGDDVGFEKVGSPNTPLHVPSTSDSSSSAPVSESPEKLSDPSTTPEIDGDVVGTPQKSRSGSYDGERSAKRRKTETTTSFVYNDLASQLDDADGEDNVDLNSIRDQLNQFEPERRSATPTRPEEWSRSKKFRRAEYNDDKPAETLHTPVNKQRGKPGVRVLTADLLGAMENPGFTLPPAPQATLTSFDLTEAQWQHYAASVESYMHAFVDFRKQVGVYEARRVRLDEAYRSDISASVANFQAYQLALARDEVVQQRLKDETHRLNVLLGTFHQNWSWYQAQRR